jgi:hypothetical protein
VSGYFHERVCCPLKSNDAIWVKPSDGFVKFNVDVSFHEDSRSGSAGAIIRDITGNFIATSCIYLPHVVDSKMAEALAM